MIKLTRLDGSEFFVNPDLIETIEETPDTHLTLANGKKYLVLEKTPVIVDKIVSFKAIVLRRAQPGPGKKYLFRKKMATYRLCCLLED
uniref:Flagellar protein FlbD n=1 Tax=Geobacter metallireducens TaxID=28232 RepID=A0A831XMN4_GEOME